MSGVLYPDVLRAVMNQIAVDYDVEPNPVDADALARSVGDWPPFPDSAAALTKLKRRFKLGIISNVNHASFAHSDEKLGIDWDLVITAEDAGAYKPDRRPFQMAFDVLEEMGIEKGEIPARRPESLPRPHARQGTGPGDGMGGSPPRTWRAGEPRPRRRRPSDQDLVVATLAELADLAID